MNEIVFIVAAVAFLLLAVFLLSHFDRDERTKRRLRKSPRQSIAQFPDRGRRRVVGRVASLREPLTAPLSGRPCIYSHVIVSEMRIPFGSTPTPQWKPIVDEKGREDFLLNDGTGWALVRVKYARVVLTRNVVGPEYSAGATPKLEAFLSERGRTGRGWLGSDKQLRWEERVLESGDEVAVCGTGRWAKDVSQLIDSPVADGRSFDRLLVLDGEGRRSLLVSDDVQSMA